MAWLKRGDKRRKALIWDAWNWRNGMHEKCKAFKIKHKCKVRKYGLGIGLYPWILCNFKR